MNNFFDELRVVSRKSIIELKSIYGVDPLRDIPTGNVTNDGTEYVLTAASGGTLNARLDSAERGPYPPGQEVEPGAALRTVAVPVGGQGCRLGYYDDDNGWFFQFDADGLKTVVRRESADTPYLWGAWDGQDVVGMGSRKFRFSPMDGYVYQIPFTWYGFGPTQFNFQMMRSLNDEYMKTLREERPKGATSIAQPHLPIRCEVYNAAGDPPYEVRVAGRQVSVVGDYNPINRETSVDSGNITLSAAQWRPMVSVKRQSVYPYALTKVDRYDIASTKTVRLAFIENGEDLATGWTDIPDYAPGLTLLQQNLTLTTAYTDLALAGNLFGKYKIPISGAPGKSMGGDTRTVNRMPMIEGRPITIYGRLLDGEADTPASGTFTFREDF